jgi:hypothetical protein
MEFLDGCEAKTVAQIVADITAKGSPDDMKQILKKLFNLLLNTNELESVIAWTSTQAIMSFLQEDFFLWCVLESQVNCVRHYIQHALVSPKVVRCALALVCADRGADPLYQAMQLMELLLPCVLTRGQDVSTFLVHGMGDPMLRFREDAVLHIVRKHLGITPGFDVRRVLVAATLFGFFEVGREVHEVTTRPMFSGSSGNEYMRFCRKLAPASPRVTGAYVTGLSLSRELAEISAGSLHIMVTNIESLMPRLKTLSPSPREMAAVIVNLGSCQTCFWSSIIAARAGIHDDLQLKTVMLTAPLVHVDELLHIIH